MDIRNQSSLGDNNSNSGLNRREFMGGVAACAAGLAAVSALGITSAAETRQVCGNCGPKAKIRLIFTHTLPKGPTWPNIGYDYEGRKKELTKKLSEACPGIEFLSVTAATKEEGQKILESDAGIDGYIVYMIGLWTNGLPQLIAETKKPTIFIDDLYGGTGEFLITYAQMKQRDDLKLTGVASSRFEDVVEAVRCFECLKKLKASKMLVIGGQNLGDFSKPIKDHFGVELIHIDYPELDEAYKKADRDGARMWAKKWISGAKKVVEPSKEEIEKSGAMYLALLSLLEKYKAQAVTINCLGGFYGGKMTAYPCLSYFQLDNDGRVGGCEADERSTLTKMIMSYLVGRPGFISDPVIDTSKNQIIYSHCVAPNKVYGPCGSANQYYIRSHSEDRKGASIRSLMPLGEMVTTIQFDPIKQKVILHQGKTVANIDEDKACRTKLAVEVKGDIDKLFNYWHEWGWHRVTFYGDLKRQVKHIAALAGYKVIEEA